MYVHLIHIETSKNYNLCIHISKKQILLEAIFENSIIHKPAMGHVRSHTKFGPDRFSSFDKQTKNTQTDKQSIYR